MELEKIRYGIVLGVRNDTVPISVWRGLRIRSTKCRLVCIVLHFVYFLSL